MEPLFQILTNALNLVSPTPLGRLTAWIEAVAEYLDRAEQRNRVLRIMWFVGTILLIVITTLLVAVLWWAWGWKVGAIAAVILWGVFFGVTGLLFLQPKAMTAIFGAIVGVSLSEISSGAGLIAIANKGITSIAIAIGAVVGSTTGEADPFIKVLIWTFVLVTLLVSLPAFFAKDMVLVAQPRTAADQPEPASRKRLPLLRSGEQGA